MRSSNWQVVDDEATRQALITRLRHDDRGDGGSLMRSSNWRLFWGLLFLVLGCVWLWNNLEIGPRLDLGKLWPLLLVGLGVYIILRQTGRLGGWSIQGQPIDRILGDLRLGGPGWQVQNNNILTIIGDVDVDLRQSVIPEGETTITVRCVIGDVDVIVPADVAVSAGASVVIGETRVLDKRRDGFFLNVSSSTPDYATATRKLYIEAEMIIGEARITRAA